ncbi:hypothetical protein PN467_00570 [Microcystis aeruginosa CS-563/04]|uniref:hypothetical protein n=1 Tax=Microcystis aeruginosa TaxID=1126 RepID=UPI002330F753|nr:hypothetical protein [Microcystis aeruginosa]MDB9419061.1 hypothetical protein [Microcystis aeruginosa CS-563/04]
MKCNAPPILQYSAGHAYSACHLGAITVLEDEKRSHPFRGWVIGTKPNTQICLNLFLGFFGCIVGFPYVYRLDKEKAIEDFRQAAELFRQQGNAPAREKALQFLRQLGAV